MSAETEALDAAACAREVAVFTALCLMRTNGDGPAALALIDDFVLRGIAEPESFAELDARTISQSAIRGALALRGEAS